MRFQDTTANALKQTNNHAVMTQATMTLVAEVACSVSTCLPGARSFESVPVALRVTHSSFALSYVISSFEAAPRLKQN